ncbi:hypothetical protein N8I77_003021 [Diaporthe amygdali]|uniref:AAA+ ATPase domain-containing protein n=1 Tax=Phomopsis amygdali TaxID=1214568 RepID=A0AAD9SH58_PHOAM|nr:hypothetical protein N8I77_003021 [Diaporthe amygdali]
MAQEDFSEEGEYDQPRVAPRKAPRFPSRISQRHRQLDEAEEARMLRAIYGTTDGAAPTCEPTSDNAKATTGSKAVSGSKTTIGSEAMTSTGELRLYLMNNCSPHCTKVCPCCKPRWSDLPTPEAEEARIAAMERAHGIINRISPKDGNKTVQIEVQNKHMKDILTSVFDGFPEFHPSLLGSNSAWVFKEPFSMFVGRWSQLLEFWACATPAEKKAWGTLVATLSPVVQPALDAIKRIKDTRLVAWDDLSLIFPPGKLMIIEQPGAVQSVVRVKEGKESYDPRGQKLYRLRYEFIDWDGETYGLRTGSLDIPFYSDYKNVSMPNLRTMPLEFCLFEEDLVARLISRGRKWSSLMGIEYKHFAGKKVPLATRTPIQASGRIMIDATAFYDTNCGSSWWSKPILTSLAAECGAVGARESAESVHLPDDQCLLASGVVCGYDLETKQWCLFPVDGISEVSFNNLAYDKLVLPPSEKKMAWAFVESKNMLSVSDSDSDDSASFDDFVTNKGKGLVMLLCGPPGVGKTYTAEAIAEMAEVPLYMMSAGELGSVLGQVEGALDTALNLCRRWKAMLLLDEADVFLGKRFSGGNESIERNELVSIFLRRLEYYQGTMFLTTNRIQNIDDAFQSRIDIILPYGDLTAEARLQVWVNFIKKSGGPGKFDLTELEIEKLAQNYHLNGREIKNLVKSSLLVAGKFGDTSTSTASLSDSDEMDFETGQAKVSMEVLETLAELRTRAHELMGKTKAGEI